MVSCLILDAGPLITNGYSTLNSLADEFFTTPSVYNEIRDERARQNLLLWGDKLDLRQPSMEYIKIVSEFAKKTGDYAVLSPTDIQILALTYELEYEKNHGDWRLRKAPGQSRINGPSPFAKKEIKSESDKVDRPSEQQGMEELSRKMHCSNIGSEEISTQDKSNQSSEVPPTETNKESQESEETHATVADDEPQAPDDNAGWSTIIRKPRAGKKYNKTQERKQSLTTMSAPMSEPSVIKNEIPQVETFPATVDLGSTESENMEDSQAPVKNYESDRSNNSVQAVQTVEPAPEDVQEVGSEDDEGDEDDEDGWITPDNLQQQQILDGTVGNSNDTKSATEQATKLKVGMASGDFAMQNVALQIGLNVINPQSGRLISKIRSWMLRCHACYFLTPPPTDKPKLFCPRCGGATLLRCTVTTSAATGQLQIHLKKNFQWSHRGNKYSLPNPQSRKNRMNGGEGTEEILLREDQKEYLKAVKNDAWRRRHNEKMLEEWIGGVGNDAMGSPFASGSYKRDYFKTGVKVGKSRYVNERRRQ
ncbi:Nin one binding Zn-ribbon like-domain-containing protein [Lipomyces kononenkoae]|uniref:Nin one binding Zn-ribbon like-domain-containing protein n=1 Tax=Lipomyces kononenkoae TaxID=34357 RepID=A0ACC3TAY8_LIPKO